MLPKKIPQRIEDQFQKLMERARFSVDDNLFASVFAKLASLVAVAHDWLPTAAEYRAETFR
jgi:hypothetical protein